MKPPVLIILTSLLCTNIISQNHDFKVGKLDESELSNNVCPIDTNAEAYVIADIGRTYYTYVESSNNFQVTMKRKVRIKFLKNTSFEHATFEIPTWKYKIGTEYVTSVKGFTYNLQDGKVIKTKLTKESQFKESVSNSRTDFKITMPNVKEGSIIDLEYEIVSPSFWNIRQWYFQWTIPCLYSEYKMEIPEFYIFKKFSNGYISIIDKYELKNTSINFLEKYRSEGKVTTTHYESSRFDYKLNINTYTSSNIPAFKEEPYISSYENFISSIQFELESEAYPYRPIKNYTKNWESINKELLDYEDFGGRLNWTGFIEDEAKALALVGKSDLDKAVIIYSFVQNAMKWNGLNRLYASNSLKDAYKQKNGSSSEINLLLVAMLRNVGIEADPIILSTRKNGLVLMSYPVLDKFNYVICGATIEGKIITLDATDPNLEFGMLPYRCLNGQGRLIHKTKSKDVDLKPSVSYSSRRVTKISFENEELKGSIETIRKGYAAQEFRETFKHAKDTLDFIKKAEESLSGLTIGSFEFSGLDSIYQPVRVLFNNIIIANNIDKTDNLISLNPMVYDKLNENPFKLEERKYPVDYGYNIDNTYVCQIEIPKGYIVDELPKPIMLALPSSAGKFTYNASVQDNHVQLLRKFTLNKVFFGSDEYNILKEFYSKMVEKEAQLIVFKKSDTAASN